MDATTDKLPYLLFREDPRDRIDELLRLTLPYLTRHDLPVDHVHFSLGYHYHAGHDQRLKQVLDAHFEQHDSLSREDAVDLFHRFIYDFDEKAAENFRVELIKIAMVMVDSLAKLGGQASEANGKIREQIDRLIHCARSDDVLQVVSRIITEARNLAAETGHFSDELVVSRGELTKVVAELESVKLEANIDPLTGINNRRVFERTLKQLIEETVQTHVANFSLVFMDIDHFKRVNDNFGHLQGDKVLRAIGTLMRQHTKGGDLLARYGGEEFVILLPDTRVTNAFNLAENLRLKINKLKIKKTSDSVVLDNITASFGVAAYRLGEEQDDFIARCDKALYRAKKLGRDRVVLAD
jgi:diguanylate cyclase